MKTIVVAGDLIWDYNLVRHPRTPAHHHEPVERTVLEWRPGGAWFVADLIRLSCRDLTDLQVRNARVKRPVLEPTSRVSRAYSLWQPPVAGDAKRKVWRIEQFLGCQAADERLAACPIERDVRDPDVLVIDDLNLGFRRKRDAWPRALGKGGNPKRIVWKTVPPLAEGPLWDELRKRFSGRVTVVLSAAALRDHRAAISEGLSWDRTLEDTVREMTAGMSADDLGRCGRVIVQFGGEGAAVFGRVANSKGAPRNGSVAFERLVYHPEELEGSFREKYEGTISGPTSIVTAAVVRHEVAPESLPLFFALGRGLAAVRVNHEKGGGTTTFSSQAGRDAVESIYAGKHEREKNEPVDLATSYYAGFPHAILSDKEWRSRKATESDLLHDLTGSSIEYVYATAVDVVLRGVDAALAAAPKAHFGKYFTVDRQEIERINVIRRLMKTYAGNPADNRPLSIAVFGQPGSGKSFAIKQLAQSVLDKSTDLLEFNLSQMGSSTANLHEAFQQVRDASIRKRIPLVFWDEFDADGLTWLKEFLAPMQDAEFRQGGLSHPFGRSIFVFAGGTCHDIATFRAKAEEQGAAEKKVSDFISRLRGFVDIKGPNPVESAAADPAHLIRRAVMLRGHLERVAPDLIDPESKLASVSANVARAFLRVDTYLHGARSLEAIVTMSRLSGGLHFAAANLPPAELLSLHVTLDFSTHLTAGQLEAPMIDALAKACHEAWKSEKEQTGWRYGPERDDEKKLHHLLVPYDDERLKEADKESNRLTARLTQAKVRSLGYEIVGDPERKTPGLRQPELRQLIRIEHDVWLRDRLLKGWQWAPRTNEKLRLHRDVAHFDAISADDQRLDRAIAKSIVPALASVGFGLRKVQ